MITELETALKDNPNIDNGEESEDFISETLRPEIWKSYLDISTKSIFFDEIFDLPEQSILRQDCQNFVAKLGNVEEEKVSVLSDLESILTYHRKSINKPYETGNGWIELLLPLIALKLPRSDTYLLFEAVVTKYVPRGPSIHHLFNLILLYHDPSLYSFLDTKRITPEQYATTWFQTLFAGSCSLPAVTLMWDLYFQQGDPFFILFLGLVMIINARDSILLLKDKTKDVIVNTLSALPSSLQESDVQDFCSLAQNFSCRTPGSFRQDLERVLFDDEDCPAATKAITQALCLPVNVSELVDNIFMPQELSVDNVRFFLVDCRSAEQYNAGHLPTAFHLDCNLMLQAGDVYKMAVQGLLSAQKQALDAGSTAGGEHLCFMGCGYLEQDQYTHMVVASFLRDSAQYVSILNGGYHALHQYFGDSIDQMLADHNGEACIVCLQNSPKKENQVSNSQGIQSPSRDLFEKIGAVVKSKSVEVKDKLLEYIVNPGASDVERHVKSTDKKGRRYRNVAPVFSIDDEQEPQDLEWDVQEEDEYEFKLVSLSSWRERNDIIAIFECYETKSNQETYKSELLISKTHIYVLRHTNKKNTAKLVVRKPLTSIVKITSKKRCEGLITFKYGSSKDGNLVIQDMDSFYIPQSKQATTIIMNQICERFKELKEKGDSEDS
ncbi:TBC1 domain family member 23 isoform X2 [Cimex lectularius]|uniref:TBC1 domain family member 23 n=1 Tax=Cimex lectularius TaxID=79782 RepID=A0A8I6S5L5_CIMLE|nr:TBC1 domain family member 23 isoform X2 [Cimex lectularius]